MKMSNTFGWVCISASIVLVGTSSRSPGQPAGDDERRLRAEELKSDEKTQLNRLSSGAKRLSNPMSAVDRRLLEKAAQWLVYRVTWKEYQERIPPDQVTLSAGQSVYDILNRDVFPLLPTLDPKKPNNWKPEQQRYMEEFSKILVADINKVLANPAPIARINAARILARLGESGIEEMEGPLTDVLKDPNQLDAVKFYALVGLENLFRIMNSPVTGQPPKSRDKETEAIDVLLDFLKRKQQRTDKTTADEDEAFRYLRREAIRALGYTKYPSVKKNKVVGTRTAYELLRIMTKQPDVQPAPSPSEQVTAAISLCQLNPKESLEYQFDTAMYHLARVIVENVDTYNQATTKGERLGTFRYDSFRLRQVLEQLRAEITGNPKLNEMVAASAELLKSIQNAQAADPRKLREWLEKNRPTDDTIYKGVPNSVIPLKSL